MLSKYSCKLSVRSWLIKVTNKVALHSSAENYVVYRWQKEKDCDMDWI